MQIASCLNPYTRNEPARSPGESTPEGFKQYQLPSFNTPVADGFVQRARYGGSRGITMSVERHDNIIHRHTQLFAVALIMRRLA